jgi:hypothetical protein
MKDLHLAIARQLGVPARLAEGFASASQTHKSELRNSWAAEIDEWIRQPEFPPSPNPTESQISHQAYEEFCSEMLQSWGYLDAVVTRYTRDGGIDIEASELVVQCKHYTGSVGVREIREIFGIAAHKSKTAVVFCAGSFTAEAKTFAGAAGVGLFQLSELSGTAKSLNGIARLVQERRRLRS